MVNLLKTAFQNEDEFAVDCRTANERVDDLQFRINRRRNMPVVKAFGEFGYYLFPSENSYDQFKANDGKLERLDSDGMGVPLLQIRPRLPSVGSFVGQSPIFIVYKFVLADAQGPPLAVEHEVVAQNAELRLCRVPFCEIYRNKSFKSTEYRLIFPFGNGTTCNCIMKRSFAVRDLYSAIGEVGLRWSVGDVIFGYKDHYTLQILDDCVPNLLDDSALKDKKKAMKRYRKPKNIVIGHYTRTYRDVMPHKYSKRANLYIGERSDQVTYGIENVPWATQLLACQGLLIQYIEHERRRDRNNQNNGVNGA